MSESPNSRFPVDQVGSRFLDGLAKQDRATVLGAASQRRISANCVVVRQGDPADHLFMITKGCARYFYVTPEGKNIVLMWLTQGEIFGASALLSKPSEYLVGTEIVRNSCVLVWERSRIRALAAQFPPLLDNALSIAQEYLTWYVAAHTGLVCDSAEQRLARILVTLAQGIGRRVSGGIRLELTNEQLANAANVTPFTASRILNHWQRNGAIVKSRCEVLLRFPEQLIPAAAGSSV
jgi:CRP/FNR family transcriptional regulator, nitrogen oxide reductase regulator